MFNSPFSLDDLNMALCAIKRLINENRKDDDFRWRKIGQWGNIQHATEHLEKVNGLLLSDDDDLLHAACRLLMALQLRLEQLH